MENQICRKSEILYLNIHLKRLFDVIYQFSLRKYSAKAVSSGFYWRRLPPKLVIDWAHVYLLHGGFKSMFVYVLKRAWLIGGRTKVKARLRNCIVCAWYNSRPVNQIMAPQVVVPSRPFSKPGVNFAGPFSGLRSKGRGTASSKGYVVVFVCMSTKALLIVRRGKPTNLYSDNATNFRGADLEQHRLLREAEMD